MRGLTKIRLGGLLAGCAVVASASAGGASTAPAAPEGSCRSLPHAGGVCRSDFAAAVNPAWSPDGRTLAFAAVATGSRWPSARTAIYLMRSDGTGLRRLTEFGNLRSPSWSPNGREIAVGDGGISIIRRNGSGRRQISRTGRSPDWGPGGRKIAYGADGAIKVMNPDGTDSQFVAVPQYFHTYHSPTWSPDGERLAFFVDHAQDSVQPRYLGVIDRYGGPVKTLIAGEAQAPDWSPDGRKIAFSRSGSFSDAAFSLHVLDIARRRVTRLRHGFGGAWSPDGRQIVFAEGRFGVNAPSHIYVMNVDGSDVRQLTR